MATIAGAVGSHTLTFADAQALRSFETAVQFQFFHGLGVIAIMLVGLAGLGGPLRAGAAWLMLAGTVLFCGSIYARAFGASPDIVGVAPYGGVGFMLGWLAFAASVWLRTTDEPLTCRRMLSLALRRQVSVWAKALGKSARTPANARPSCARCKVGLDLGLEPDRHGRDVRRRPSEELVAEAVGGRREQVYLVSKVLPENASRRGTIAACEPA